MDFEIRSQHRKTCRRINEPGHAYALTLSCFRRRGGILMALHEHVFRIGEAIFG